MTARCRAVTFHALLRPFTGFPLKTTAVITQVGVVVPYWTDLIKSSMSPFKTHDIVVGCEGYYNELLFKQRGEDVQARAVQLRAVAATQAQRTALHRTLLRRSSAMAAASSG
jgi:hypothetical protein